MTFKSPSRLLGLVLRLSKTQVWWWWLLIYVYRSRQNQSRLMRSREHKLRLGNRLLLVLLTCGKLILIDSEREEMNRRERQQTTFWLCSREPVVKSSKAYRSRLSISNTIYLTSLQSKEMSMLQQFIKPWLSYLWINIIKWMSGRKLYIHS